MKKIALLLIILISTALQGTVYSSPVEPLIKFTEIAQQHGFTISNWEVSHKETINVRNPQTYVNNFRMYEYKGSTKDENSINYLFEDNKNINGITVYYSVIIPRENNRQIELTAVIKGNQWDENVHNNYMDISEKMDRELFSANVKSFACLELLESGIIGNSMIIETYILSLGTGELKVQYDNVENSTINKIYYGYTPLWEEFFSVDDAPLNLQIAITERENGDLSYKIGTPILINEY